ncbi:hypothetical protein [Microseira wollei]|nr:hypothetical protein [Microseira wollei]
MPCPYATTGSVFYYGQFNGHDMTGKTRPYNIKNYTQPMLQDTI